MRTLKLVATALALASVSGVAPAADPMTYPNRPIRVIVPNTPGSSVDTLTRIVTNRLTTDIGQQLVIDNRAGAGGIIGMEIARSANPDGHTLIAATTAASTIARLLVKKPTFDPVKDYDSVVQFAVTLNVLVVNPKLPIRSVKELIDYAKSGKKPFNMASAGVGSQSHLSGAYFQQQAGIDSLHVPYKGGGPSSASVVAGESQWTLIPSAAAMVHVNAGRMRALGQTLPHTTPLLPGIPPISDTIPGFSYTGWMGFFTPRGTPSAIVDRIGAAVAKTMQANDVKKGMTFQATEIVVAGPVQFRKVVEESMVQNAKLVKSLDLATR